MAVINFAKMHGLGNDFVVIDCRKKNLPIIGKKAKLICDRHFGIGCDQIIVIRKSRIADYRMQIYNADGSEVEMCGNGIRCFAKYLWDRKEKIIRRKKSITVETLAGIMVPEMCKNGMVKVDMGVPVLDGRSIPTCFDGEVIDKKVKVSGRFFNITAISMGNPHAVLFVKNLDKTKFHSDGPLLEGATDLFPNKINVEFVEVTGKNRLKARVWERGSGPTLACGTGACAIGVASVLNGMTGHKMKVDLPGGTLQIEWKKNGSVFMTGPATEVFTGQFTL